MREKGFGIDNVQIGAGMGVCECVKWRPRWKIEKYDDNGKLYAVEEFDGNMLLNEGITELLKLLIGASATPYSNSNTYIGVGDGASIVTNIQDGLQGVNKAWSKVDSTYPQISNQTVTFRATFGPDKANFTWNEFTIVNASNDNGKNLNRKVEYKGVKSGGTWVVELSITIS